MSHVCNTVRVAAKDVRPGRYVDLLSIHPFLQGISVKIAFAHSGTSQELMWVSGLSKIVDGPAAGKLSGTLDNVPEWVGYVERGDNVHFWPEEVLDVI